nr:proline-, glutamic acid- and leucine-rich protein 1-like [Oncorhynchus nerka]
MEADKQKEKQDPFQGKYRQNMVFQTEEEEKKGKYETVRKNRKDDDDRDCPPPYATPQTLYPMLPNLPPPLPPPVEPPDARPLQPAAPPHVSPNTPVIDHLAWRVTEVLTGSGVTPARPTEDAVGGARQKGTKTNPFLKAPPPSSSEESEDGGAPLLTLLLKDHLRARMERCASTLSLYNPASGLHQQYPLMACPNPQP